MLFMSQAETTCEAHLTCQQLVHHSNALLRFLETRGVEPTKNATERAMHQSVIQRQVKHGVQSR